MEEKNIFGKASVNNISSPEQLTDYIRVSSPSLWVALCAIMLLLVTFFVWCVFGLVEVTTLDADNQPKKEVIRPIDFIFGTGSAESRPPR